MAQPGRSTTIFLQSAAPYVGCKQCEHFKTLVVDIKVAKRIGRNLAIKSSILGILIAYILFAYVIFSWDRDYKKAIIWIFDVEYKFHLFIGIVGLLTMSFIFGQLAGLEILIKKRNYWFTGVKYGILVLITGTLIGSSVGFFQEGIQSIGGFSNPFYDYYFKPMYWILMFGTLPAIFIGLLFGRQIKIQGTKYLKECLQPT